MRRIFTILPTLAIIFLMMSFGGITTHAENKSFDNWKNGTYSIEANAKKEGTNEQSIAAEHISNEAMLTVENDQFELTLFIPDNDILNFSKMVIAGVEPIVTSGESEGETGKYYLYTLSEFHTILQAVATYEVPSIGLVHENVGLDFHLSGLDEIPEKQPEKEQPNPAQDERIVGSLMTEAGADAVYELTFGTDSNSTRGNLLNPVKLLEKDGKQYIQMLVNESAANFFRSLKINGQQVMWNSLEEGPYTIQFELLENIENTLFLDMVIQAGPNVMAHGDIGIWFETDSMKTIKEPKDEPEVEQPNPAQDERIVKSLITEYEADAVYELTYETDSNSTRSNLLNPVKLLEKDGKQYIQMLVRESVANFFRSLKINGQQVTWNSLEEGPYTIQFELLTNIEETLTLDMVIQAGQNVMAHDGIGIWFDTDSIETVKEPKIEQEEPKEEPKDEPKEETEEQEKEQDPKASLVPDKAGKLNFVIKQETVDELSVANGFFEGQALLLEKNGVNYIQITTTADSGAYIKSFRNKLGHSFEEMVIVEKTDDGRITYQFRVDGSLSDVILLDMIINVLGIYENQYHVARLFLDIESLVEVDANQYQLVASTNSNGPDAPKGVIPVDPTPVLTPDPEPNANVNVTNQSDQTPKKPEDFGTGTKQNIQNSKTAKPVENGINPQTGDSTNVALYVMLLIGSMVPLAFKFTRRFV